MITKLVAAAASLIILVAGSCRGAPPTMALILIEQIGDFGRAEVAAIPCGMAGCNHEFDLPVAAMPRRYDMRARFGNGFVHLDFYAVFPFYRPADPPPASGEADVDLTGGVGVQTIKLSWQTHGPAFDRDGVYVPAVIIAQVRVTVAVGADPAVAGSNRRH